MMPQMVQKKQLNERINKKNIREPYFLVQIKNKNHWEQPIKYCIIFYINSRHFELKNYH